MYAHVPTIAATHLYAGQDSAGGYPSNNRVGNSAILMHMPVTTMNVSVSVNRQGLAFFSSRVIAALCHNP
jgi:hypothetical protein